MGGRAFAMLCQWHLMVFFLARKEVLEESDHRN